MLSQRGWQQSMSHKGNACDNAPIESFFSTPEFEGLSGRHFQTCTQADRRCLPMSKRSILGDVYIRR